MRTTNKIILASSNIGKAIEFEALLHAHRPDLVLKRVDEIIANPPALSAAETGRNYFENAFNKARLAHFATKFPTISDDSGLEVDALGGEPGLYSARYAVPKPGEERDTANIRKLLEALKGVPKEKRTARFVCTLVFFFEGTVLTANGSLEGSILEAPRGTNGFGYDPVFLLRGTDRSLAELTSEEKNRISHRARAMDTLFDQLIERKIAFVCP